MESEELSIWDGFEREEKERESAITGKHRVVITSAEEGVTGQYSAKPGTPQLIIKMRPSGRSFDVAYRIQKNDKFNERVTKFFDAFPEIPFGEQNTLAWIGAEGGAMFAVDEKGYANIRYLLDPTETATLPPFEGNKPERVTFTSLEDEDADDGELPFL